MAPPKSLREGDHRAVRDALHDLLLGSRCAVCGRKGRPLCRSCRGALPFVAVPAWPEPSPIGLLRPVAGGAYEDPLRPLLIDFKERGCLSHADPLGQVLAGAVAGLTAELAGTVVLVPVPSTASARRRRGFDPVLLLARSAAASLRRGGLPARVVPAVRSRGHSLDQGGLSGVERSENAQDRFTAVPAALGLLRQGPVVVVDDIITTGHTLREAQGILVAAGVEPAGAAVVAATRRRAAGPAARATAPTSA